MGFIQGLFDAPASDWLKFGGFFVGIFLFIFIAEKARSALGWPAEVNRKLVHIGTGLLIFFCAFLFESQIPLIWMALIFIMINYLGVRLGRLKGMHGTERHTYGTVYYPLTFLILVLTCWDHHKVILMLCMLILALADAAAAIVGENIKNPHEYSLGRDKKSLEGSLTMFLSTFLIVWILLPVIGHMDGRTVGWITAAWIGLLTALFTTALEALSSGGSDNLTAPLGAAFVLHYMLVHTPPDNLRLSIGMGLALMTAVLSFKARFLTGSGSVGVFLLASIIFGIGGWMWTVPILTFFILSSLLSKAGKVHKTSFELVFEKSSQRDFCQVLANGGLAGTFMICSLYFPNPAWYPVYLGALAAATADTWGTEVGVFSKSQPRSILNLKKVPTGTSGGVSVIGTLGAFTGASVVVVSGWIFETPYTMHPGNEILFWIMVFSGVTASLADSLLGATLQARYRCPVCEKLTERHIHCNGRITDHISGLKWMNNDWVNGFCSAIGAFLVWIGLQVFVS